MFINYKKRIISFLNSRKKLNRKEFFEIVFEQGYPKIIIEEVYDAIVEYLNLTESPNIYPEDNLDDDYKILEDDIEDIVRGILKKLNQDYPNKSQRLNYIEQRKINNPLYSIIGIIDGVNYYWLFSTLKRG